jgi:hypothetical protein
MEMKVQISNEPAEAAEKAVFIVVNNQYALTDQLHPGCSSNRQMLDTNPV